MIFLLQLAGSNSDLQIVKSRLTMGFIVSKIRILPVISPSTPVSDVTMKLELFGCGKGEEEITTSSPGDVTTPGYEVENTTQVVVRTTEPTDLTTPSTIETTTLEVVKTTPVTGQSTTTVEPTTVVETTTRGELGFNFNLYKLSELSLKKNPNVERS